MKSKSISIGTVIGFLFGIGVVFAGTEYRYMQKSEGQQIQLNQQYELEDKLLILDMKKQGISQEQIDAVLEKRWKERLEGVSPPSTLWTGSIEMLPDD